MLEAIDDYVDAKKNREQFKTFDKAYDIALATLKTLFPLEDSLYRTDKYIIQTKKRKTKGSEYLAFDIKNIAENDSKNDEE